MFNGVDYIILAVGAISAFIGLWRGLIKEVFSLLNWVLAFGLSYLLYQPIGGILPIGEAANPYVRNAISAVLIFIVVLIAGSIACSLLAGLAKAAGLSGTDRLLGLLFGFARAVIIILILLVFLPTVVTPIVNQGWWNNSFFIPAFLEFEEWATSTYRGVSHWIGSIFGGDS